MPAPPRSEQIRFTVEPRLLPPKKAARRLHLTPAEFRDVLPRLMNRGFPRPDPDIGYYDLKAIDAWLDLQMGRQAGSVALDPREVWTEKKAREAQGQARDAREVWAERQARRAQQRALDARDVSDERLKLMAEGKLGPRTRESIRRRDEQR